ncbi:beta-glucosidase [Spirochaetia bacterium]|nr:beta-glucosidase [Spirochaetia bacterium]
MAFRDDFVWGGASASYQVEGAVNEDGRLPSVWDMFCKQEGKILDGSSGAVAADFYHRYQEDVDIMKELGYKAHRFSIAWPRVIPTGDGAVNEKGLDFYDRLVDSLCKAGITPYTTLFHWDYPYDLFRKGGWMNPDSPKWFADYAAVMVKRLGDRLKNYMTINEPTCFIGASYIKTNHAPGIRLPIWDTLLMTHNVLLGHGRVVQTLRSLVPDAKIGYAPAVGAYYPASDSPEDREAARQAFFSVGDEGLWSVSLWNDPIFLGTYPEELYRRHGQHMPHIGSDDMKIISQKLDFLGQNIYFGDAVRADGKGGYEFPRRNIGYPFTAFAEKWPISPEALYWGPRFLYERYKVPLYITENGLSCADTVSLDGKVHDPGRIDFLQRYLHCLRKAAGDGVDIRGYFHWCVTDSFEWGYGYTERFGMVYCDYQTQQRIIKDSGHWYREVIRSNGANL